MPKVSVVMPVYNASRFLEDSIGSILNQTFRDLELICVDDGSTDNSLDILNRFSEKDSRVKVFSRPHEGGGNARNYGLSQANGKYLFNMDADDLLDLNAFKDFYKLCEEKDLDFIVFKAINYGVEKDHFFETDYQNMKSISNLVKDQVFSYKDLGDLLFDFNVSPWCKFYNMEFVKNTGARFRENSKFHDNQFFWDMIFQSERILFIDKFYYTRKRYDDSLTASGDENHIDIIGVVNDIIKIFEKHNQLDNYKNRLYNLKIMWIVDRYNQVKKEEHKELFYSKMKDDFKSLKNTEFVDLLDRQYRFVYDCVISSDSFNNLDGLLKYSSILSDYENKIKKLDLQVSKHEKTIAENKTNIEELKNTIEQQKNNAKQLNSAIKQKDEEIQKQNSTIKTNEENIKELTSTIKQKDEEIQKQNSTIKTNEEKMKDLNSTIKQKENQITENEDNIKELSCELEELNLNLKKKGTKINILNSENKYYLKQNEKLIKINLELASELEKKNRFRKFFSKK